VKGTFPPQKRKLNPHFCSKTAIFRRKKENEKKKTVRETICGREGFSLKKMSGFFRL